VLLLGIDEAGYGPSLGPLCHALSAWRVPDLPVGRPLRAPDLWSLFAPAVSRCPAPPGVFGIDDSKRIFSGPNTLEKLRLPVLACLACAAPPSAPDPPSWLRRLAPPEDWAGIERDPWAQASPESEAAPLEPPWFSAALACLRTRLAETGVELLSLRARLLSARDFNFRLAEGANKAEVAWGQAATLLRAGLLPARLREPVLAVVDRQGGRKYYAPKLAALLGAPLVQVLEETKPRSAYFVPPAGERGETRIEFLERAEERHLPVALASMAAKLVREVMMARFNRYFARRQPGLRVTAGYPADARRFLRETLALRRRLGIEDCDLVRRR
jgi:hypothetical protein